MSTFARHTLIDICDEGRQRILSALLADSDKNFQAISEQLEALLLPSTTGIRIPGIVRRDPDMLSQGLIPVGFSSPLRFNGNRLRIAASVRPEEILKATNPFEILPSSAPRTKALAAYRTLYGQASDMNVQLGLWGSTALELYTGLPYSQEDSDLDLLIGIAPLKVLEQILKQAELAEQAFHLRVDFELSLPNGYGVHLKELILTDNKGLVGKGMNDVAIILRNDILHWLNQ